MIGKRFGHYEIVEKLGEGGMGEVFRARDPRLGRDVAIKVLPAHRLESAEARSRFEREARAVAALSHPNILAIHDVGETDGQFYLVMELLEGQSLQAVLHDGPMPPRLAMELAAQAAEGLAAAHEKGLIHRDIKPGNLFVTADGRLKILDFGLAKIEGPQDAGTMAATLRESTEPGRVMGTVRYMSPEQARAQALDYRSDIFSLGTVIWEMLSGRTAFDGESAVEVMNAILKEDPRDLSSQNEQVPPSVDRIVGRCLEKLPARRFQSAQDLAFALRSALDSSSHSLPALDAVPERRTRWRRVGVLALVVLSALAGALLATSLRRPEFIEPAKIMQFTSSGRDWAPAASPDGRLVAFTSDRDGTPRIWLRQVKSGVEVPLTDGHDSDASFSPDGTSILFVRGDRQGNRSAQRVPIVGGPPRRMLDSVWEVCWSPDGRQLGFLRGGGDQQRPETVVGIQDVQSGESRVLASFPLRFSYGLRWSPDGRWLTVSTNAAVQYASDQALYKIDTQTGETEIAFASGTQISAGAWSPDGKRMVIAQSVSLIGDAASPLGRMLLFDPDGGVARPVFWVQSVWAGSGDYVSVDFLDAETLIYDEILWSGNLVAKSIDGTGAAPVRLTQGNSRDRQPAFSPDGSRVVFSSNRSGNLDLWMVALDGSDLRQLTDDQADDWDPAFSADGSEILWSSNRSGNLEIWRMSAGGTNARQVSYDGVDAENPSESPDGQWFVYGSGNPQRNGIWKHATQGDDEEPIATGSYLLPEISPDGRHVLYSSNELQVRQVKVHVVEIATGREVQTTAVPSLGLQSMVQPGRARWMPDGKAIAFVGLNASALGTLYVEDFLPDSDGDRNRRVLAESDDGSHIESFGFSPDGRRLVVATIRQFRNIKLATVPALAGR